jgi:diacylglycerol kinase family enzyme
VRVLPEVLDVLAARSARVRVCQTAGLAHAADLARQAGQRGETVVAVGGDGLVGALAGPVSAAGGVLGIIPAGRGNDFARTLGITAGPGAAAAALLAGHTQAVDLIGVQAGDDPELVVAGSVYLGVPSEGGEIVNRSWWAAGPAGYQLAGFRALLRWQHTTFTVGSTLASPPAGGPGPVTAASFPGFAVVVANSAYLAAGRRAAPAADVGDGLLDVIMVRHGGKLSFARVMIAAGRGTHVRLPQVSTHQAACVTVSADRPVPAAADGETLAFASPLRPGSPLRIRALPGALRVIAPAGRQLPGPPQFPGERTWRPWPPPRKDSTKSGLADNSAGVPSIRTSPPPST